MSNDEFDEFVAGLSDDQAEEFERLGGGLQVLGSPVAFRGTLNVSRETIPPPDVLVRSWTTSDYQRRQRRRSLQARLA